MIEQEQILPWLLVWLASMLVIIGQQRRIGATAGLVVAYVLQLWLIHWLGVAIYALPWFTPPDDVLMAGLKESTFAIASFGIGSVFVAPALWRSKHGNDTRSSSPILAPVRMVHMYLFVGVASYVVLEPLLRNVATLNSISTATSNLLLVALALECWNGLHSTHPGRSLWRWVAFSALLPFITILTKGFLGYGFAGMLTVFAFVASFYRARWKLVLASMAVGYLALSLYVTYMRDRSEIRAVVWAQEGYRSRLDAMSTTVTDFEFLDLTNFDHLGRIDERLNQTTLLGTSVLYLETRPDAFAHGRTLLDAVLSVIPRALWPDKPISSGSGNLVSEFTGLRFSEETSVGIGHIMELYVNFGRLSVVLGMIVIGTVMGWIDRNAGTAIVAGNWSRFAIWWLPGVSLLQVGGSLVDALSGAGAALAVAVAIDRYMQFRTKAAPRRVAVQATDHFPQSY